MGETNKIQTKEKFTAAQVARFIIPSAIGAFLFMCPIPDGAGGYLIPVTVLNDWINANFSGILPFIALFIIVGSAIILNRIPPLSRKPDTYMVDNPAQKGESLKPEGYSLLGWAWHRAVMKGNDNGYTVKSYMTDWAKNSCLMLFGILGNDRIALHALPGGGHLHYAGAVPVRQRGDDPHHQDQSKPAGYVHHLPGAHYRQPHRGQSVHTFRPASAACVTV